MHENAGHIERRLDWFEKLITQNEVNIVSISFRGYGESEGEPTETGLRQDGRDIADYVRKYKDQLVGDGGHIFLFGKALGGCVATYTATHPGT